MNRTFTLSLALAAGLLGGVLSRYVSPVPVLAQAQTQKEIKAQRFVLVDGKNNIVGTFKPSADRIPTVVLLDRNGKEIWRAGVSAKVLTERLNEIPTQTTTAARTATRRISPASNTLISTTN